MQWWQKERQAGMTDEIYAYLASNNSNNSKAADRLHNLLLSKFTNESYWDELKAAIDVVKAEIDENTNSV